MEEGRRFLSKLPRSGRLLIVADDDADGVLSAHLFARYVHKRNPYLSILITITQRERMTDILAEHPDYTPVLLDLSPTPQLAGYLDETGRKAFAVDHHPWNEHPHTLTGYNPHLLGVPNASKYNTGFLVYLLFRNEINKSGDLWKVAVTSFGDSCYDYLKPYYYGLDERTVELAAHMVGSVSPEKLPVLFSVLEETKDIGEFVGNEELLRMKREFERGLHDILSNLDKYLVEGGKNYQIIVLPPERARFKSAVATVASKRNPDVLFAVGILEDGIYNFSLRYQQARERKVHLGVFASNLGRRWGTNGGGHAPAAGLRVPEDRLDEFIAEVRKLLS